jgi:DNA-binding transcriptional regulator YiaG
MHAFKPAAADTEPLSGASRTEAGEVEVAGRRYVTDDRLAEILNVSRRTVARWNAARIGPPKISIGKTILYDVSKLPDWLASRESTPIRTKHS